MSSDLDLINEMSDAIAKREFDRVAAMLHPDVVWEHNLGGGSPEEGTYRGREAVVTLFDRITEGWEYVRPQPVEIDSVAGAYHVKGEIHSKHATSAAEIVTPYEQRLEFHGGLLDKAMFRMGS